MAKHDSIPAATLIINHSDSKCNNCGQGVNPSAKQHDENIGYGVSSGMIPKEGCGVKWTHVSSEYTGDHQADAVKEMRPDLEYVELYPGVAL